MEDIPDKDHLDDPEDLDYLFTPEVIAELDRISACVKAGARTYSEQEVDEFLQALREESRANNPS